MVQNSDEFRRRILSFPAIRPCESVSFPTLLASLINLSRSICSFKSKTFFTNKQNAANSIRLIEALLVFLEELRDDTWPSFEDSSTVSLCLSELHFIFQKLRFLLHDCARDDARLWMLLKSEEASSHFRLLLNSVAVALDVLPPPESDAEARELLELMRKQAAESNPEVRREDRRAKRRVLRITRRFGRGIAPEPADLRRVLEDLRIGSWGECGDEIKCLESEFGQECGTAEKRAVPFISSLIAFLVYCRCTIFSSIERRKNRPVLCETDDRSVKVLNPDDFRCPITMEIMSEPVTLSTGHTYDRSSILKWFSSGNHTCPVTGEKLMSVDLVPNLALKHLIIKKFQENRIQFDESRPSSMSVDAGSVAAEQAMALLANFLVRRLVVGTNEEQNKAAFEIRLLTKTSPFNRSCFVEADAIPSLLGLIRSTDQALQRNAIAALVNLSKHPRSKKIIVEDKGLEFVVEILNDGLTGEARQHAASALFYLSSVEDNRRKIGRAPGAIQGLIGVLRDGEDRGKKCALAAILGLLMHPENHWRVLAAGLVPLLANLLRSFENEDLVADSLTVLAALATRVDGAVAIVSAEILPITVQILNSSNSRSAREYSVSLLLSLCNNDATDVVPILVKNSSLMVSLYSLIADGSPRLSKKAASLIRILHAFNEKSSTSLDQEQFVRVW
ncbi:U-box domain-containing protein 19-like [Salvia miltiorrhiza]|uniref:U-box domain-containing protein 19-like n=1 Tax=Salvia miltiorrhiza TaxID=226208 RepID=UPI0025AC2E42|nr:U-box domain-containing protein 19-like [Salvia miltiorrhiza]